MLFNVPKPKEAAESMADRIVNCDAFFYAEGARGDDYLKRKNLDAILTSKWYHERINLTDSPISSKKLADLRSYSLKVGIFSYFNSPFAPNFSEAKYRSV